MPLYRLRECSLRAPYLGRVDRAGSLERSVAFFLMEHADPLGVAEHRDTRVVSRKDRLALRLVRTKLADDVIGNKNALSRLSSG